MLSLRVAVVAPRLTPGAVEVNLLRAEQLVREAARVHAPDLIVLPEDLSGPPVLGRRARDAARPVEGALLTLLRQLAQDLNCVVAGGARLVRGQDVYVTYLLAEPDGRVHLHDKGGLSPIERSTVRAGNDDGITSVVAWDRRRIGLLCGGEWDDGARVQRLQRSGAELVIGGRGGAAQVGAADGKVLLARRPADGDGHASVTVELRALSDAPSAEPFPPRPARTAARGALGVAASAPYWVRRTAHRFPWQDAPGTDIPDECGPTQRLRRSPVVERDVIVTGRSAAAAGIVRLQLGADANARLPRWEPGAHIDVVLPDGVVRQYSLCGDSVEREYEIAVLDVTDGRGGSRWIHENLLPGDQLRIRGPRNHFPFDEGRPAVFVAGGIGVTPLLPMVRRAHALGLEWRMAYGGRTLASMAFADDLAALDPDRVDLVPQDLRGPLDLVEVVKSVPEGGILYACGPPAMLAAIELLVDELPDAARPELRLERFTASVVDDASDVAFRIHLGRTGTTVEVPANHRALDVLLNAGAVIDNSCRNGLCGSCALRVLDGTPDHRDSLPESARGDRMMVCVSRALTPEITLDV